MDVFVISTENPSKVFVHNLWKNQIRVFRGEEKNKTVSKSKEYQPKNIYITSDGEIKEGDWCVWVSQNKIIKCEDNSLRGRQDMVKKIVLTTDYDLIKDGIKNIDDNFLEWFVENYYLVRSI